MRPEQAVRREVREEAMVLVDDVLVVGSQPWPIGRCGSMGRIVCERVWGSAVMFHTYAADFQRWPHECAFSSDHQPLFGTFLSMPGPSCPLGTVHAS